VNSEERSGTAMGGRARGAAWLTGVAATVALLASGCGAGQTAGTSLVMPAVPGANAQAEVVDSTGTPLGAVAVRNVLVAYKDPRGYPRGGTAPLDVRIFNDTTRQVTVVVSSPGAASVTLTGSAAATPSGPAPAAPAPAGAPARLTIPANGFAALAPGQARYLQLVGLTAALPPGASVPLTFDFGGGVTIKVEAPVGPPPTPLPRSTPQEQASAAE
jgi:hypothetical protein